MLVFRVNKSVISEKMLVFGVISSKHWPIKFILKFVNMFSDKVINDH